MEILILPYFREVKKVNVHKCGTIIISLLEVFGLHALSSKKINKLPKTVFFLIILSCENGLSETLK